jgi:hypothetical protein
MSSVFGKLLLEIEPYRAVNVMTDGADVSGTTANTGAVAAAGAGVGASCHEKAVPAKPWNQGMSCG